MKKSLKTVLLVVCLVWLYYCWVWFAEEYTETNRPPDEEFVVPVYFRIINESDRDLVISSITTETRDSYFLSDKGARPEMPVEGRGWYEWGDEWEKPLKNVGEVVKAGDSAFIEILGKGEIVYRVLTRKDLLMLRHEPVFYFPEIAYIDCHYGNDSSSYPYTGRAISSDELEVNNYKTAEAEYYSGRMNVFHFCKTTKGDYVLATAN